MRSGPMAAGLAALAAVTVAAVLVTGRDGDTTCMRQLVPAYFAPGAPAGWDALLAATPPDVATVIMNPANGPGVAIDPAYARIVAEAREKGIAVAGYVHTRFSERPAAEVAGDAVRYRDWYGVDRVFLDEASSDAADLPYYRELAASLRDAGARELVLNPGRVPDEGYADVADILITFEGSRSAYEEGQFPAWTADGDPERFAHLVYDAAGAQPGEIERLAADRNAGSVYVTDDAGANPWDTLPGRQAAAAAALEDCGLPVEGG